MIPQRRDYETQYYKVYLLKWQSWLNTENWKKPEQTVSSPFNTKERSSQQDNITNPILIHSREVLTKVQVVSQYHNICRNILCYGNTLPFILEKKAVHWKQWHSNGIHTIVSLLCEYGKFISYGVLTCQFNLEGEQNFSKYLQIRNTQRIIFWIIWICHKNAKLVHVFITHAVVHLQALQSQEESWSR